MWEILYSISPSLWWFLYESLPAVVFEWLPTAIGTVWVAGAVGVGTLVYKKNRFLGLTGAGLALSWPLLVAGATAKTLGSLFKEFVWSPLKRLLLPGSSSGGDKPQINAS